LQRLYRTVWELKMKDLCDMAANRGAYIDQSQSFNAFMETPTKAKVTSMHFYTWKAGLKTGMYYLRTRPAVNAIQFTVDKEKLSIEKPLSEKAVSAIKKPEPIEKLNYLSPNTKGSPVKLVYESQDKIVFENIGGKIVFDKDPQSDGFVCTMDEGCMMCGS